MSPFEVCARCGQSAIFTRLWRDRRYCLRCFVDIIAREQHRKPTP